MQLLRQVFRLLPPNYPVLVWLIILACVVTTISSGPCENMTVFSGKKDVTNRVCKQIYVSNDRNPFTLAGDRSLSPSVSKHENSTYKKSYLVHPPHTFYVDNIMQCVKGPFSIIDQYVPVLRITWTSPLDDKSRQEIKGFFITIEAVNGTTFGYRMISIDHSAYPGQITFEHTISMQWYRNLGFCSVRIYSLPFPTWSRRWMLSTTNFQKVLLTVRSIFLVFVGQKSSKRPKHVYPANWPPSISVRPNRKNRSIDSWLPLPSPSFGFDTVTFQFQLKDKRKSAQQVKPEWTQFITVQKGSKGARAHVRFNNVPLTGYYQVFAGLHQYHEADEDKCECHYMRTDHRYSNGNWSQYSIRKCVPNTDCPSVQSPIFDMNFDAIEEDEIRSNHNQRRALMSDDKSTFVLSPDVLAGVLAFLAVSMGSGLVGIILYRRKPPNLSPLYIVRKSRLSDQVSKAVSSCESSSASTHTVSALPPDDLDSRPTYTWI